MTSACHNTTILQLKPRVLYELRGELDFGHVCVFVYARFQSNERVLFCVCVCVCVCVVCVCVCVCAMTCHAAEPHLHI